MALLFAGFTGISKAQQTSNSVRSSMKAGRMQGMHQMWKDHARRQLLPGLTEDQKKQIKDIMLKTREAVLPLTNQLREKEAHLQTLQTAGQVDMKAVDQTIDEMGALRIQIAKKRAASRQDIRKLLTDEQRVVFDSRKASFMDHGMRYRRLRPKGRH